MRWLVFLLMVVMIMVGVYDQFSGFLGVSGVGWWAAIFLLAILFFYYILLMPRGYIQVRPEGLRVQGSLKGFTIGFDNIVSVASSRIEQHFPKRSLSGYEREIVKPIYYQTCLFIEITSYPESFRRRLWFPRLLFSESRVGLICHVEDWMDLSRKIEQVRMRRGETRGHAHMNNRRTLVGQILAEDIEFNWLHAAWGFWRTVHKGWQADDRLLLCHGLVDVTAAAMVE